VVARKWAAEKERGKRLSRAFVRAHKWLKDPANRDEAIAILKSFTKRNDKVMAEAYDLFIARDKLINDDAAVDTAGVANEVEIMTQNGGLPPGMKMGPETYMLPRELGGLYR
jgi:ABC-type nitrate/sulfonate/bicarbonate transport system substrate-binding protein